MFYVFWFTADLVERKQEAEVTAEEHSSLSSPYSWAEFTGKETSIHFIILFGGLLLVKGSYQLYFCLDSSHSGH